MPTLPPVSCRARPGRWHLGEGRGPGEKSEPRCWGSFGNLPQPPPNQGASGHSPSSPKAPSSWAEMPDRAKKATEMAEDTAHSTCVRVCVESGRRGHAGHPLLGPLCPSLTPQRSPFARTPGQ